MCLVATDEQDCRTSRIRRIGDLLRSNNLTVEQLQGLIAARTGLKVDMR